MHRVSREVVRCERERPGELLHLDAEKPGRIPPGGGKRFAPGFAGTGSGPRGKGGGGLDCVHVAIDDRSRYACAEALPDGRGLPRAGDRLLRRPRREDRAGAHRQRRELPGAAFREAAASTAWGGGGRGRTGRRRTARRRPPSRSCRPSGRTGGAMPRTGSASTPPGLPEGVQSRPSARRHRRGRPASRL